MMKKFSMFFVVVVAFLLSSSFGLFGAGDSENNVLIIGHRGAMGYAPENTMESFRLAKEMGVDYLEFDVQMTKDGVLVAIHDTVVSNTTSGTGEEVKEMTLGEIKELTNILTVREIFEEFGDSVNYYIETKAPQKYPGVEENLIHLLNEYDLLVEEKVILHSASKDSLKKIHELAPDVPLGLLLWHIDKATIPKEELFEIKDYVSIIISNYDYITRDYVETVKNEGFLLHAYTINKKEDFETLINWGLDGIITDYPDINQ